MKSKQSVSADKYRRFKRAILRHFKKEGRNLPWRKTRDPYRILVSEIMLQQTQVDRVIPKYRIFLKRFPTPKKLAEAKLAEVLTLWQGLGYNRRALYLKRAAERIHASRKFPRGAKELMGLPGIGSYTASALRVFAWNKPDILIETNIRSVFIHFFFEHRKDVSDNEIFPLIKETLSNNPRLWYSALMDYGAMLKREEENPSRRSAHHVKQSSFQGSNRQLRGTALRALSERSRSFQYLRNILGSRSEKILETLRKEGLVLKRGKKYALPS